jgi:hypothetical protein
MIQEKGMTSNSFEKPQLEQKTTSEISEQKRILTAMAENNLLGESRKDFVNDLNNKLWISKDSYDKEKEIIIGKLKDFNRSCVQNLYSEFEIIKFLGILIQELENKK